MGKVVKAVLPIAAAVIGSVIAPGIGTALGSALAGRIAGFVISTAISAVGQRAFKTKPKAPPPLTQQAIERREMIRSSVESHKIIYGRARVSGPIAFGCTTSTGADNNGAVTTGTDRFQHLVILLAAHEVDAIETIYLNDLAVSLDGNGFVTTSPYYKDGKSYVRVIKHLGASDQVADNLMVSECPNWTTSHRLQGIAYVYVRFEGHPDVFPLGRPNVSAVVKGKKVYDPRSSTTAWSENAALCARDYLTSRDAANYPYGYGVASARLDDTIINAAANICDENVTISTGGTHKRYVTGGVIDTATAPNDNMAMLVSAMAGAVTRPGGKFRIHAGAYDTPETTVITDDMLIGPIKVRARVPRKELFNAVRGTYVDPNKSYQPTDFPPITSSTYETEDNGERIFTDLELPFTTDPERAQRIAKLVLRKAREQIVVDLLLNYTGIKFAVWDTVKVTHSAYGWTDKIFRIEGWTFDPGAGVHLQLKEENSASYDWTASDATVRANAPDTNLPSPFTVQPPGAPAVAESLYTTTDGSGVKTKATVTWGASSDAFAREYELQYKLTSASTYIPAGRTSGLTLEVFDLAPGVYDFRVRTINTLGVTSAYASNPAQIFGLTTPPADIGGFSLNAINNNAHLSWLSATDLDVRVGGSIRIRYTPLTSGVSWSSATDLGPALPGVATQAVLPLLTGTYLIKAVDSAGNESVNAVTITSTVANVVKMNLVATSTQHSTFSGTKTNMVVVGSDLFDSAEDFDSSVMMDDGSSDVAMRLDSADTFDSAEDFDSDEFFDAGTAGFATTGTYLFVTHVDVGKVTTSRVTALLDASVYDGIGAFDSTDLFDGPGMFDGDNETAVTARLYVRTTNDDPAGTPTWSDWRQFFVGDYTCRAYQFKLEVESTNGAYNIDVRQLSVTVDMPDVVDNGSLTTSASGLTAVTFARTFIITPALGTTVKNGATGDFVELTSASATGFSIGVKDSGGSYVARNVDWISRGY